MALAASPKSLIVRHWMAIASTNVDPPSRSMIRLLSSCARHDVFGLLSWIFLYPFLVPSGHMHKPRVHFHPFLELSTLGRIIFIHLLRCTVPQSLSQSLGLPRYFLFKIHRFCSVIIYIITHIDGKNLYSGYIFFQDKSKNLYKANL